MRSRICLVAMLGVFALSATAYAQMQTGSVRGLVKDKASGETLATGQAGKITIDDQVCERSLGEAVWPRSG